MKLEYLSDLLSLSSLRQIFPASLFFLFMLFLVAIVFFGAFFHGWKFKAKSDALDARKRTTESESTSGAQTALARKGDVGEKRETRGSDGDGEKRGAFGRDETREEDVSRRGETLVGRVFRVDDGDTLWMDAENERNIRIRFQAIDAPEKGQDFGDDARRYLNSFVCGRTIRVEVDKADQYGRVVGRVWVETPSGTLDVEEAMLRKGLAWHYRKFNDESRLADAQREAKKKKTGLWSQENPVPPWRWRWEQREKNGE